MKTTAITNSNRLTGVVLQLLSIRYICDEQIQNYCKYYQGTKERRYHTAQEESAGKQK